MTDEGLKFTTEMVGDRSMVSLSHKHRTWYINTQNDNGSSMRIRFSDEGMAALIKLHAEIQSREIIKGQLI